MRNILICIIILSFISNLSDNTIKGQTINYNNPLWAFDYMREAWKNNIDFLEAEHKIITDSSFVNRKFRDYYGQALMTVQTFNGKISDKDRTYKDFRNPAIKLKQSENLDDNIKPVNANKFILENFSNEKVIMFNEAHLYPQHRTFINSLLRDLYNKGYRHLFMETLSKEQMEIKYPEREMGIYTNEPCMANLVRNSIQIGYKLHAYDGYEHTNRDSVSAQNIYRVIQKNPQDKFIIICGFEHNNEKISRSLAAYLNQIAQIDPLTIDLTVYSEPETSKYYYELVSFYHITHPSILTDTTNKHIAMKNSSGRDIYVIFPPTTYIHGYPTWMVNQYENKWDTINFTNFDVAKVYIKDEIEHAKSPIPYSFKYQDNNKKILVPCKDYIIRFYKLKNDCPDYIGYYDSQNMKIKNRK